MDRQHILDEIRRTAAENGNVPLGRLRFFTETAIRETDWNRYWARWSDAVREAGFTPNEKTSAYREADLLPHVIQLMREIQRFPVQRDLKVRAHRGDGFPADSTFRRLGTKSEIARKILAHLNGREGFDDVIALCSGVDGSSPRPATVPATKSALQLGYVYLIKSGRHYKIGKSNAVGRREREIALQLPERSNTVHAIKTDDPAGIEAYWHGRFASKRKNGEWFALERDDVDAFKRRKFM